VQQRLKMDKVAREAYGKVLDLNAYAAISTRQTPTLDA
jgi:hypothetical protein